MFFSEGVLVDKELLAYSGITLTNVRSCVASKKFNSEN